ncbi:NAD(P)-dependent dehydrogenase (short-subunit alcohol dehydrogenase family)/pimeloyl-ACP methyl ester carboxylesterase [Actinomadura coerulea]|uniref:NAD(P)-dependent dehydrogenase (Short-subunit alcohol dehydrogenase family)/pimeloyl-ACP methyl ester carboxylesterase n=2 Tax=Actinomadura coerulea TaxID=46159 RepID=A0A7X0G393_9ACTN|nr:NAD(P)-dependent dehydrogenase (short-subunit alcohol dehydrogenase family)/pimeloyl-ACP methyl ester carboxylesterase [Actinomadura coerulea]
MPMRDQWVRSGEIELAVRVRGAEGRPTVVLVHGYPDTGAMWDEVAGRLGERFRVVVYDVRGAGASGVPADPLDYRLDALMGDLEAVLDGVGADEPVHLVGHDWGSVQGWEAVIGNRLRGRVASFTSISGPDRRHMARWAREAVRSGPRGVAEVLGQARRSVYMPVLMTPWAGEVAARVLAAGFGRVMRLREGAEPRSGHPAGTLPADARHGLGLYRANMGRGRDGGDGGAGTLDDGRTDVPVQLIVPVKDRYGSQPLLLSARGPVERLYVRRAPAGHWVARSHPDLVARWIGEFVEHVEGGPETPAIAHARAAGLPGKDFGGDLVVVTGAGSGIGRATAHAFAAAGARVVAADIDEGAAERTVEEIQAADGEAHVYGVDVADAEAMERFAGYVRETFGVPDVVVNNAGIAIAGSLLETSEEEWNRIRSINLDGMYRGSRLFGRQMVERGEGGHIVNLSSMVAYMPSADMPAYGATKAAVLQMTESLRLDLDRYGIGVSAVCPGVVDTPIVGRTRFVGLPSGAETELRERIGRASERRGYSPERVAGAILRAVRQNRPVVLVTAEARFGRALSRVSPTANRALARMGRRAGDRIRTGLERPEG